MPPLSAQSNPFQTPTSTRPFKRRFGSDLPASSWVVSKKFRKPSDIQQKMTPPPLPPVQSDVVLAIFVHSSLKVPMSDDRFGDGRRLAFLGQRVLRIVIAEILFEKRPMMDASELEESAHSRLECCLTPIPIRHR